METYKEFVKKYGERPPDIVFAVTRKDTIMEVGNYLEGLKSEGSDTTFAISSIQLAVDKLSSGIIPK